MDTSVDNMYPIIPLCQPFQIGSHLNYLNDYRVLRKIRKDGMFVALFDTKYNKRRRIKP
jgi:hypothetical protein